MYETRTDQWILSTDFMVPTPTGLLGPELITLGDFSADTGWTLTGGAAIAAGILTLGVGAVSRALRTEAVFPVGTYRLSVDLLNTSGSVVIVVGAGVDSFQIEIASPAGTYAADVTLDGSSGVVLINGTDGNDGVQLDNFSLKKYL